jgi:hypothetical protein
MSRTFAILGVAADTGSVALCCLSELTCMTTAAFVGGAFFVVGLAAHLAQPLIMAIDELPEVFEVPTGR